MRRWRFLFVVFDVRIWLRYALERFTFPDAVSLNRFFAPLRVFILGIRIFLSLLPLIFVLASFFVLA